MLFHCLSSHYVKIINKVHCGVSCNGRNGIIKFFVFYGILFALLFGFSACQKKEPSKPPAPKEAITQIEELSPVEIPEINQGLITFYSGDVSIKQSEKWIEAQIGDLLEKDDFLKTGPGSYCEIQFGDTAVVRVQEDTEISMSTIALTPDEANVGMKMAFGSVLCKVQKLTGSEKFKVQTQTAVCGVRGTEFAVKVTKDNKTVLAVKEGTVAVLPATVNVEELRSTVEDKGEEVLNLINKIEEAATVVAADQELHIDETAMKETEKAATAIKEAVEEIAKTEEKKDVAKKIENLQQLVQESKQDVAQKIEPPKAISEENAKELKTVEKMKMLELPVAQKVEKETKEGEAKPAPAIEIKLIKVSVAVVPEDSIITLNGEVVGTGRFSGIYNEGTSLS
ncbi:MAG: FecR domain-containing protein, partial [Spirochaetota bacterium]